MPAIRIEDLSPSALAFWERRGAAKKRTVEEEIKRFLEEGAAEIKRLPIYVPSEEYSAPFDLPYLTPGIQVQAKDGGRGWPDPATLPRDEDSE
jgi:hypothetical protein